MKAKKTDVKKLFEDLQKTIAERPSPFAGMSEEETIEQLRKVRKTLWEKKLAART
jgi:hypothetical protein